MKTEALHTLFLKHPVISTDTRKIIPDSIFFALKGEHFNGNAFASSALENGAAYAVIDEKEYRKDERYLLVEDVLASLQELAQYHRKYSKAKVIALTGSNGKTTTKELMNAVLKTTYKTHATQGNLNNHIGVPLTLLSLPADAEFAIIEMGANHQKEIEALCGIALPDYGLITNVGKAHLEGFGGFEGVMKGKGEMYDFIQKSGGSVFIHSDNVHLRKMAEQVPNQIVYGSGEMALVSGHLESEVPYLVVSWKRKGTDTVYKIHTQIPGSYNFENILAAICVGVYFDVKPEKITEAISQYRSDNNRSQIITKGSNTILADAYNANPSSMDAAIANFSERVRGKKVLIIGDMMELGEESDKEHRSVIEKIKNHSFEQIVLIGEHYGKHKDLLNALWFKDSAEADLWLKKTKFEDTNFLLKGSRKMQLEKLIDSI